MSSCKKLRVLCLHGYHQNKDIFRQKTGSFRKPFKKHVDFEFFDAPHLLEEHKSEETTPDPAYVEQSSSETGPDGRGWWLKNPKNGTSEGLQTSLDIFEKYLSENEPFDGIMGFSQGAAFLALVCILLKEKSCLQSIKFVILVAGFKSLMPGHERFYDVKCHINIPSLHVIGDTDGIISPGRSRELLELFSNCEVAPHPGGHYVAMTKELKEVYKQFIEQFLNK